MKLSTFVLVVGALAFIAFVVISFPDVWMAAQGPEARMKFLCSMLLGLGALIAVTGGVVMKNDGY